MSPQALAARIGAMAALILALPPLLHAQDRTSRIACGGVSTTRETCRTGSLAATSGSAGIIAGSRATIHCGDDHGARIQCGAGGYISSARIIRQQNTGRCSPNDTWGYGGTYVWSERMCIADFEVTYSGQSGGTGTRSGTDSSGTIRSGTPGPQLIICGASSRNSASGTVSCNAGGRIATARLVRSDDRSRCRQGSTWGWSGREIWTKNGCRGDFEVAWAVARSR